MTGIGLGVETSVQRVIILRLAAPAHGKNIHGSFGSVIGDILDDGIPGTAIGTVDKRIGKSSIFNINHLFETISTDRNIRRNQCGF